MSNTEDYSIKVIAPLSPAGDFPVTSADNINYNGDGNTVANALSDLEQEVLTMQREIGLVEGEGNSSLSSQLSDLDTKVDTVQEDLTGTINDLHGNLEAKVSAEAEATRDVIDSHNTTVIAAVDGLGDLLLGNTGKNIKGSLPAIMQAIGYTLNADGTVTMNSDLGLARMLESWIGNVSTVISEWKTGISADFSTWKSDIADGQNDIVSAIEYYKTALDQIAQLYSVKDGVVSVTMDSLKYDLDTIINRLGTSTAVDGQTWTVFEALKNFDTDLETLKRVTAEIKSFEDTLLSNLEAVRVELLAVIATTETNLQSKITEESSNIQTNIADAITAANATLTEQLGTTKSGLEDSLGDLEGLLVGLRAHLNTMIPPTLEISRTGLTVYDKDVSPTLIVSAKVNRPLENPLVLYIGDAQKSEPDEGESRKYSETWNPTYQTGASLPYVVNLEASIRDNNDTSLVYSKKTVSCTFAANVYWGMSDINTITDLTGFDSKLSAGHPSSLTFTGENKYCYYCYPSTYGTPSISVGGFTGGFTQIGQTILLFNIPYNIYRSNQKLNDTTITIK